MYLVKYLQAYRRFAVHYINVFHSDRLCRTTRVPYSTGIGERCLKQITMQIVDLNNMLGTILKHDRKQNSYKIALLRSINDILLTFPTASAQPVAMPLRMLAEFWVAYYFPFVDSDKPILQGIQAISNDRLPIDMSFRDALTNFRTLSGV